MTTLSTRAGNNHNHDTAYAAISHNHTTTSATYFTTGNQNGYTYSWPARLISAGDCRNDWIAIFAHNQVTDIGTGAKGVGFYTGATNIGWIYFTASTASFAGASDYRLKENLSTFDGSLEKLRSLPVWTFNFKTSPDRRESGFLAHELADVAPYAVFGEKDAVNADGSIDAQSVDYSKVVPLVAAGIKELDAKVLEQEKKLAELEAKIAALQLKLSAV